jgi:hypothetical protein
MSQPESHSEQIISSLENAKKALDEFSGLVFKFQDNNAPSDDAELVSPIISLICY